MPGAEEFGIFDYEADFEIGELDDIDYLNEVAEELEMMSDCERIIVNALIDEGYRLEKALEIKDDCIYHPYQSMADIAYYYYIDCGVVDEDSLLINYVDWERVGRDMAMEGHFIEASDGSIIEVCY